MDQKIAAFDTFSVGNLFAKHDCVIANPADVSTGL